MPSASPAGIRLDAERLAASHVAPTPVTAPLAVLTPAGPTLPTATKEGERGTSLGTGPASAADPGRRAKASADADAPRARALERASLDYLHDLATARSGLISARATAPPPPLG